MDPEHPILTIVGVEGHLEIVRALREHFDRPVEAMVITGQGMEYASRMTPGELSAVHSLPGLHARLWPEVSRLSDDEVIRDSRELQEKLNLDSVNPHHFFDRNLRQVHGWTTAIRRHLVHLQFVHDLLVDRRYYFIRGENTSQVGCIIQAVSPGLGHRFLRPRNARAPGRLQFESSVPRPALGWQGIYDKLSRGEPAIDEHARQEGEQWLEQFLAAPKRPEWAKRNSRLGFQPVRKTRKYVQLVTGRITRALSQASAFRQHDRQTGFTRLPGVTFMKKVVMPDIRSAIHQRRSLFRKRPSLDGDFVYFPLHYTPEISTLVYGYRYEDQFGLIRALSGYLPTGHRLLVKEHTSMLGRRPYSFYRQLDGLYNVEFVPPQVNTFDLIRGAKAVATITGTAGFEAFVLGKPVLVCGEVFYRQFPNVLGLEIGPGMGDRIRNYLDDFQVDHDAIRNSVLAYFGATYRATMVDTGGETVKAKAKDQAMAFASACEWALARLAEESPGTPCSRTDS